MDFINLMIAFSAGSAIVGILCAMIIFDLRCEINYKKSEIALIKQELQDSKNYKAELERYFTTRGSYGK